MQSKQSISNTDVSTFLNLDLFKQEETLNQVDINELGNKEGLPLLKKFIAMKVLVEAKKAASVRSPLNITSKFRNMLSFFGDDLQFWVLPSAAIGLYREKVPEIKTGYRIGYISEMGYKAWERRFFSLGVDDSNNILIKSTKTTQKILSPEPIKQASELECLDNLINEAELRSIFTRIKQETRYDNTLGYDLFCAAMTCANALLDFSSECCTFVCLPLALLLNVAIYAAIIPTALVLTVMEHLVINPVKWVVEAVMPDEHEEFIQEVASIAKTLKG